jgi:hypothetical protein
MISVHRVLLSVVTILVIYFADFKPAYSQIIKGYGAMGFNMPQVDGDEVYGYKKYLGNLAVGAMVPIGEKWHVSLETSFTQKGGKGQPGRIIEEYDHYNLRLNYLEVPVLVHFTDKDFLTAGLGLSWGRLVGIKELEDGIDTGIDITDGIFGIDDIGVLVDLRLPIYQRLKFNFRFQYSMAEFREREYTNMAGATRIRNYYNNVLTFRVVYMFNEDLSNLRPRNR